MFRALLNGSALADGLSGELRLLELHHATELFRLVDRNRAHLQEWMPWVEATKEQEDTEAFLHGQLEQFSTGSGLTAGIWCNDALAGVIGTLRINWLDRRVEIGYWIAAELEGKGLVTEAARLLVDYLLGQLDLHRVEIRCGIGNLRSNRIPERLGFKWEGVEREAHLVQGTFQDMNRWAMLQKEWRRLQEGGSGLADGDPGPAAVPRR